MSSVINPVGPEEPGVYWRRRLLVGVAALIALTVVLFVLKSCGGGTDPVGNPTEQPSQSVQPSESPSGDATGNVAACNDSDIGVAIKMEKTAFAQGDDIVFQMHITNNSANECSRNLGPKVNTVSVTSGPAAVWSSDNCLEPGDDDFKNIPAGKTYVVESTWKQDITAASCATPFQKAQPGGYDVVGKNVDVTSDKVAFTIN